MYRIPAPREEPKIIDVVTVAQLAQRRRSRLIRIAFVLAVGCSGWYFRDQLSTSGVQAKVKAQEAWQAIVQSFYRAFPAAEGKRMVKGQDPREVPLPPGGSVSPIPRTERVRLPDGSMPPVIPRAEVVEDDELGSDSTTPPPDPALANDPQAELFQPLRLSRDGPQPLENWPRNVAVGSEAKAELVSKDEAGPLFVYRSQHYEFHADAIVDDVALRELARVFEATYLLNCQLPLALRPTPEPGRTWFKARLFSSERAYLDAGAITGSAGTYSRMQKCILVPLASIGLKTFHDRVQVDQGGDAQRTLIHEVTHQMMNPWLPRLPIWLAEGSAEYVAMADYIHGRFVTNQMEICLRTYFQRRARALKDEVMYLHTGEQIFALNQQRWNAAFAGSNRYLIARNYASAAALTFYFYHLDGDCQGILRYLRALESGQLEAQASHQHLLRGRSPARIGEEMMRAFARLDMPVSLTE